MSNQRSKMRNQKPELLAIASHAVAKVHEAESRQPIMKQPR